MRYKIKDIADRGMKISHIFYLVSYISFRGGYKKTHPLNEQGWDTEVFHGSTLVTAFAVTHWRFNGRTRRAISDPRLRSGILPGRGTEALQQMAPSLRILPDGHVFLTAFYD